MSVSIFHATSVAVTVISPLLVTESVQSTCAGDICIQENHEVHAVVAHESTTSATFIATLSVTVIVVSVIVALSISVSAVMVITGTVVSIIYDWLFNHNHPFHASCAETVAVPLVDTPVIVQVTGCAYGSELSPQLQVHVHIDAHSHVIAIFVMSFHDGAVIVTVLSFIVVLLIGVGTLKVTIGG